jgi:hypothetical protein
VNTGSRSKMTTVVLTANAVVTGTTVHLVHTLTDAAGVWKSGQSPATDPTFVSNAADSPVLISSFSPTTDYALRLTPVKYFVDFTTDPTNPKLMRKVANAPAEAIAEQIIGFKVGASARNANADMPYSYNASADWPNTIAGGTCDPSAGLCGYLSDWAQIRAVRISLIGRTPLTTDPLNPFRNAFDGGPYRIEGIAVTINPRNLSMTDQ